MNVSRSAATASSGGASCTSSWRMPVSIWTRSGIGRRGFTRVSNVLDDALAGELDSADLDDRVGLRVETGRLEVEGYVGGGQCAAIVAPAHAER